VTDDYVESYWLRSVDWRLLLFTLVSVFIAMNFPHTQKHTHRNTYTQSCLRYWRHNSTKL